MLVPVLYIRAIRGFRRARNRNVTVLCQCEKSRFARQRHRRGPVWRKSDKARPVQIERKRGIAIGAVQMQTEECHPQQTIEQKLVTRILSFMQYFINTEEAGESS